jgi:hypothetical protein
VDNLRKMNPFATAVFADRAIIRSRSIGRIIESIRSVAPEDVELDWRLMGYALRLVCVAVLVSMSSADRLNERRMLLGCAAALVKPSRDTAGRLSTVLR